MTNRSSDDLDRDHTDELPVLLETVAQRDEEEPVFATSRPDDTAQHASLRPEPSQSASSASELRFELAERSDEIAILQSQIAALANRGLELEQQVAEKDELLRELEQTAAALRQSTEDALGAERRLAAQVAVRDGRIAELTAELDRLREASATRDAATGSRAAADPSERGTDQQRNESPTRSSSPTTARELQRLLEEKAALSDYIAGRRARWEESQAREASLGARVAVLEKELADAENRAEEAEAFATRESGRAVSLRSELVDSARRVAELERELKTAVPLGPVTSDPSAALMPATAFVQPTRPQAEPPRPATPAAAEVPVVSEIVEAAPQAVEAVAQLEAEVEYKRQQVAAQLVELRDRDQQIRSAAGDLEQVRRELGALRLELEQSRSAASRLERAVIDKDRALDARDARITTLQEELRHRLGAETLHASELRPTRLEPLPTRTTLDVGTDHAPAPVLLCLTGDAPKRFALTKKSIIVGRGAHCDLQIITHVVSREHARITLDEGIAIIEDAGSRNGVFVNSVRIDRQALQQGDLITIGDAQFRFIDSMAH